MKTLFCALTLALTSLGHIVAQVGAVEYKNVVLTGSISYTADDPAKPYITIPLTKTTLLQYFGPGGVKAADTAFFSSADHSGVVLASKDGATVYLTVMARVEGDDQSAIASGKNATKARSFQQATFCNGTFTGYATAAGTAIIKPKIIVSKAKTQFAGSGIFPTGAATKAVLVGTFSAVATAPVIKAP
jgi:hypothetical protein